MLFSQSDRTTRNVFIDEFGNINLIDNDQYESGDGRTPNSIFLPMNVLSEMVRVDRRKMKVGRKISYPRPTGAVTLDYRCHAEGGAIGFNYPPKMKDCLKYLDKASVRTIQKRYEYPLKSDALDIKTRAQQLFKEGFEGTLRLVVEEQRKLKNEIFPFHEPCCFLRQDVVQNINVCSSA